MPAKYDEYYSAQDHALGPAFEDVIALFQNLEIGQTVLDVDVGQGRDAIPLAQMGHRVFEVSRFHTTAGTYRFNRRTQKHGRFSCVHRSTPGQMEHCLCEANVFNRNQRGVNYGN